VGLPFRFKYDQIHNLLKMMSMAYLSVPPLGPEIRSSIRKLLRHVQGFAISGDIVFNELLVLGDGVRRLGSVFEGILQPLRP
jgi:hypothetical protein